jgi:PAS domain S-box-containing protein
MALLDPRDGPRFLGWTGGERPSLLWVGLFLAAVYWLLESAVHVVVFQEGEFIHQLLTIDPHEVWKRLVVASLLILFSLYAQRGLDHRKRIEKSLRSAHAELKQIFQTASVAMRLIDRGHRVLKVNETFVTLSGVAAEEAGGGLCHEVFAGDLCHTSRCPLRRIVAGTKEVECEVEKTRRDGTRITCVLTARPFLDEDGELLGIVESFRDVTQAKAAHAAAIRSEQLAALGELAAGVAHEINNPINGIINYGQILVSKRRDPRTVREVADQIVREGGRVADIVVSLLSFARRDTRQYQVCDLGDVLRDTLTLTAAQMRKEGIRLEVEALNDLPPVACIPQEIQQVFLNILNNARYALAPGNGATATRPEITIAADRETVDGAPFVRLSFQDNGTGIPGEWLDKVTNPFFSSKPRGKGTGLGLSISHGIVTDHGGRLLIESTEGEYTRVSVLLPVCDPPTAAIPAGVEEAAPGRSASGAEAGHD